MIALRVLAALFLLCFMVVCVGYYLGQAVQDFFDDFNDPGGYI